jgi:hypothetical protein
MAIRKKTVNYRVDGCACQQGYVNIGDCDDDNVYDKDGAVVAGAVITAAGDCPQEVVMVCDPNTPPPEPPVPPVPFTVDGQDCAGVAKPATGLPGQLTQIVQAPGQVLSVRMCSDDAADFELACGIDPDTGHTIQTAYKIVAGQFVVINRWDVNTGAAWTGDATTLASCAGVTQESDPREVCVNGAELTQWVVMEAGMPTGTVFYTNNAGQLVEVAPDAVVTLGVCPVIKEVVVCLPTISSAFGNDLASLSPGHSVAIQKSSCCVIRVVTSAGSFLVGKGVGAYSTGDFNCPVTVDSVEIVSGPCTAADVIVTTQGKG